MSLLHGAIGWSAVCECVISWPHSLPFYSLNVRFDSDIYMELNRVKMVSWPVFINLAIWQKTDPSEYNTVILCLSNL